MQLVIEGPQKLNGSVSVSGAKNAATRILAAALVSGEDVRLHNFPITLLDAVAKINFAKKMGARIEYSDEHTALNITVPDLSCAKISDFDLPIRTTYLLAASTLIREGRARIPYPGGCKIGARGYDQHILVWRALGCTVDETTDTIEVTGRLTGGNIDFLISTVGGTENALICAAVAIGETLIRNAYVTPEVADLIAFLRKMGAKIQVEGNSQIRIQGANGMLNGTSYQIMPDRIEALTWIILGLVTRSNLLVHHVPLETMEVPLLYLREAGIDIYKKSNAVQISPDCIDRHGIQPFEMATGTYPGVVSDMQSFFAFLGLFANGRSVIYDYRYPDRIAYARQLAKFAPQAINSAYGKITLKGPANLQAAHVNSTDLRGSMVQIMAAICAQGQSKVDGVEMALRGYNDLPKKLEALGVVAEWIA